MSLPKFFKSKEWKLLWPFYVKIFFFGFFSVMTAFGVIYFQNIGLSYAEIGKLMSIAAISIVIFELPTGAIADTYGRRFSTILGLIIMGLSNIGVAFFSSFGGLVFLFSMMGLGASFVSGAYTAWIVDFLKHENEEDLVRPLMVKFASFASAGAIIGPLFGSLLASFLELKYLWIIQGSGIIGATLILVFFTKEYFDGKRLTIKAALNETVINTKTAIKFSISNRAFLLIFIGSIFGTVFMSSGLAWQPLLVWLKMPIPSLGYLYSIIAAVGVFAPFLSGPALRIIKKEKHAFWLSPLLGGALIWGIYFIYPPMFYLVCLILIFSSVIGQTLSPIESTFQQRIIPSKQRATIISFKTMVIALTASISNIIAGKIMDVAGPRNTLLLFTIFLIPAIICCLLID